MKLINKTKNTVIVSNLREARTLAQKIIGLLGYKTPAAIFFRSRWGIHTFGMKFPVDVIICDSNFCVRKVKTSLLPNRFLFWNPRSSYIFELPPQNISKSATSIGDMLEIAK